MFADVSALWETEGRASTWLGSEFSQLGTGIPQGHGMPHLLNCCFWPHALLALAIEQSGWSTWTSWTLSVAKSCVWSSGREISWNETRLGIMEIPFTKMATLPCWTKVLAAIDSLHTHCLPQNESCPSETSQAMISVDKFDINAVLSLHHASHHWQQEPNPRLNVAFFSSRCLI